LLGLLDCLLADWPAAGLASLAAQLLAGWLAWGSLGGWLLAGYLSGCLTCWLIKDIS